MFELSKFQWSCSYNGFEIDGAFRDPDLMFEYWMSWGYFRGEICRHFYDFGKFEWQFRIENAVCPLDVDREKTAYFFGVWDSDLYNNGQPILPFEKEQIEADYSSFRDYLDSFIVEQILDLIAQEAPKWLEALV